MKGINVLSVVPMRKEPSDKSEMVNQILFGETFDIIEKQEKWSRIQLHHDKYEGWIDNKQWAITSSQWTIVNGQNIITSLFVKKRNKIYTLGSIVSFDVDQPQKSLIQTAKLFLDTPYLWGGRTFIGIDCSGFTQVVFKAHGINLLRDAYQQQTQGKKVKVENCETNDLAFFCNADGKVVHVGIVFKEKNKTKIIHASGKVRIDLLDEKGIFNEETQTYSHNLHSIKRMVR